MERERNIDIALTETSGDVFKARLLLRSKENETGNRILILDRTGEEVLNLDKDQVKQLQSALNYLINQMN